MSTGVNPITIKNAKIIYRNFKGEGSAFNPKGKRNFSVVLNDPDDHRISHLMPQQRFSERGFNGDLTAQGIAPGEPAEDPEQQGQEPSGKDGGAQDGKGEDPKETEDIAPGTLVTVVIRSGQGSEAVAKSAEAAGLVADAKEFDRYLEQNGYSRRL